MRKTRLFILLLALVACTQSSEIKPQRNDSMDQHTLATDPKEKKIKDFFSKYEESFNLGIAGRLSDTKKTIKNSFADCFVESSPAGVSCGKNDKSFLKKIEKGYSFYQKIGSKSMKIVSNEITRLDDFHSMAKVGWRYTAEKDTQQIVIDFTNFYFLSLLNDEVKIFSYVAGDEQKALKEHGLIP